MKRWMQHTWLQSPSLQSTQFRPKVQSFKSVWSNKIVDSSWESCMVYNKVCFRCWMLVLDSKIQTLDQAQDCNLWRNHVYIVGTLFNLLACDVNYEVKLCHFHEKKENMDKWRKCDKWELEVGEKEDLNPTDSKLNKPISKWITTFLGDIISRRWPRKIYLNHMLDSWCISTLYLAIWPSSVSQTYMVFGMLRKCDKLCSLLVCYLGKFQDSIIWCCMESVQSFVFCLTRSLVNDKVL